MLRLKNVSKFYYNKGIVTSGFSKISVEFNMGEFVVITGESGSGKSTLLNVISGLDTYEEGEMYINGEETSHYNEVDFELYRRKYIGNIFQNFNLINSYTVYQNVELVLLINGNKSKDVKTKIYDILKNVDMYKYRNTKVSKLSGGQKQRVAIARALAKDTAIIIADEPTGNLDSRSAVGVLKLLNEIAKDKLVIVVTHNYEQVEDYATRKIRMHDGRIIEDKILKKVNFGKKAKVIDSKEMSFWNQLRLGIRNAFNVIPKFVLLLLVYLFVTLALASEYSTLREKEYINSKIGYNSYFTNMIDTRIVINKKDKALISDLDYEKINSLDNIDYIIKDDLLLDIGINVYAGDLYLYGNAVNLKFLKDKVDIGRVPETDNEIVIAGSKNNYYLSNSKEELLDKEYTIESGFSSEKYKVKIVGIKYTKEAQDYSQNTTFYINEKTLNGLGKNINEFYSEISSNLNGNTLKSESYTNTYKVIANNKVPKGSIYISSDLNYYCPKNNCKNAKIKINVSNLYYKDSLNLKIKYTYTKDNFKKLTGIKDYDTYNGAFFVNGSDYNNLFNKGNYQSSVFVKDVDEVQNTIKELNDLGFNTLYIKDTLISMYGDAGVFLQIFRIVLFAILTVGLFFVSYFIIILILKSRNIYFSTIRILGSSKSSCKRILDVELFLITNIAYLLFIAFVILGKKQVINITYVQNLIEYLSIEYYLIIYFILLVMSFLISNKFARRLFKESAMNTYREEI